TWRVFCLLGDDILPTPQQTKEFKTYEQQLQLLMDRGLIVPDKEYALSVLRSVNYYRLSAYSLTLRKDDGFYPQVSFSDIVELYDFDGEFRALVLKYTLFVEITFRTHLAYYHAAKYGALGYLNGNNFESEWLHAEFLSSLKAKIRYSSEPFIIHHREDLKGIYPIWVAVEVVTFGMVSKFFKYLVPEDRASISKEIYGISREYIENWLQCTVVARNIAAHGGRFYNKRKLGPDILFTEKEKKNRLFSSSTAFAYVVSTYKLLLSEESKIGLIKDLGRLFKRHPFVQPRRLGFPNEWENVLLEY
ncbi:MAG: Abi family protein, partial [Oscillospiraceae bacterium]